MAAANASAVYLTPRDGDVARAFSQMLTETRRAFEQMDEELEAVRNAMRLQVAGIDMPRYVDRGSVARRHPPGWSRRVG